MNRSRFGNLIRFGGLLALALAVVSIDVSSYARGGSRSGGSSFGGSRSSSFGGSRSSGSVFGGRSGGGIFGGSKPSAPAPKPSAPKPSAPTSASGLTKPGAQPAAPPTSAGGLTKPAASAPAPVSNPSAPTSAGGLTKPGAQPAQPAVSAGGLAKPGAAVTAVAPPANKTITGSRFDQAASTQARETKALESRKAYEAQKAKFAKPAPTTAPVSTVASGGAVPKSPILASTKRYGDVDYNTHYARRDDYWSGRGWNAPTYVYSSSPSFGMWDAMILWAILDNNNDGGKFAYNHANDPGYQEWRREADRLAADNADLRDKLAKIDKEVAVQAATNAPRDEAYLPPGVPAEVAVAADALAAVPLEQPTLRVATGTKNGRYHMFGSFLGRSFDVHKSGKVEISNTAGSYENLRLLIEGKADAALVQSDVLAFAGEFFPGRELVSEQAEIYTEAVHLVGNDQAGISDISDLVPGTHTIYVGPDGSGTAMTWKGLAKYDPSFAGFKTVNGPYADALKVVASDPNSVMLTVSGLNNSDLKRAPESLCLISINRPDLCQKTDANGNPIYSQVEINEATYPNLCNSAVTTLGVDAVLVLRTGWVETYGSAATDALSLAIMEQTPRIVQQVHQEGS